MTTSGIAVDEEHDVGTAGLVAAATLDHELLGYVVNVVVGMFPVDVVELKAPGVSLNRLLQAPAQAQQVVDLLVGPQQAVVHDVLQCVHGRQDVALAEGVLAP